MNREEISKEFEIKFNGIYGCHSITKISAIKFAEFILKKSQKWNPASEPPDNGRDILVLVNFGKVNVARSGRYVFKFSEESTGDYWDSEILDYRESDDTYYCPEGYYLMGINEGDNALIRIDQQSIIGWQELPPVP